MTVPARSPRTHARPPLHPPPLHAPPRAARTHRTKVLDCVLPVACLHCSLFLSLSLRVRTVHHPTRKGWKGAYVLVLRGTTTSTPSGGKPLSPPSPFSLLFAAHTDILVPLPPTHRHTGVAGRHGFGGAFLCGGGAGSDVVEVRFRLASCGVACPLVCRWPVALALLPAVVTMGNAYLL